MPGDGDYYVALFPRPRGEAAPTFAALAGGKTVKVDHVLGTDYAFLASEPFAYQDATVRFKGTAGIVQIRGRQAILTLSGAGELACGQAEVKTAEPPDLKAKGATTPAKVHDSRGCWP